MSPQRIQRKRTKRYRLPAEAIYVGRPSRWGNPFRWSDYPASRIETSIDGEPYLVSFSAEQRRSWAAIDFENALVACRLTGYPSVTEIVAELAGHDLACWCPVGHGCHADLLLLLANGGGAS